MQSYLIRKKKNQSHDSKVFLRKGFTLIEMMVSTSIFIIVMTVAAGSILSITSANRKSQATKVAIDNLSFALESMSRHIRVGTNFSCSNDPTDQADCSSGGDTFSFMYQNPSLPSSNPYVVTYRFENGGITVESDGQGSDALTGSDLTIDPSLSKFYVEGAVSGVSDGVQPRVMIVVKGTADANDLKSKTDFNIQTSVTQRALDF